MEKCLKKVLGFSIQTPSTEIVKIVRYKQSLVCKPCWEIKYCPYGPLVEQFPIIPPIRSEAIEHNEYLKECISTGRLQGGKKLDKNRKKFFIKCILDFKTSDYPVEISGILKEISCRIFGHICPVYFNAEPFTETKEIRRLSREIPRDVMLKVVRRDGQICQKCFKPVPDNKMEFDHLIPFSKGGTTSVDNLRLLCFDCNRKKRNLLSEILDEIPLEKHFKASK
ncbi:MAG: HNH endonuclease signature motif containing protein [Candidatus Omnitrophota bacterium]